MNTIKTMNTTQFGKNALNEAETDELIDLLETLSESHDTLSLEGLDGIATAMAVMIRPVKLGEIYPLIVEEAEENQAPKGLTQAQWSRFEALLMRRVNHTHRLLSHGEISDLGDPRAYHPWVVDYELAAKDDPELAKDLAEGELPELAFEWALGFISTVEYFAQDWRLEDELLDDELNPMLSPFYALVLPREEWPDDIRVQDVSGDSREAWFAQSIWAAYELWEYWRHHAPQPKVLTVVKEARPGRNDPCPCGSGKKYKQCHGAN